MLNQTVILQKYIIKSIDEKYNIIMRTGENDRFKGFI
jgi:hypothetical protein